MPVKKKEEDQFKRQGQLDDVTDKILNREKFSYDLNGDAFYQQYKDKFTQQGKMAMMDTMGQAAALTGGYGSSYAQSVGQQAYQGYLQNLNDVVPELYQMALDRYDREGDDLMDQYSLLADQEAQDYSRKRDAVADQQWDRSFAEDQRRYDQNYAYQEQRDQTADQQWRESFDYQKDRDRVADGQWNQKFQADSGQTQNNVFQEVGGISGPGYYNDTVHGQVDTVPSGNDPITPTKTANTNSFISSHMTLDQALSRGITKSEWLAMIQSALGNADLTDGEFMELERYYGIAS